MTSNRLLDQPRFNLGSLGTRHVLEDLRDMILGKSKADLEREIFVCADLVEVFNTALRWDPEITDLFVDENRAKAFHAFYAFGLALGKNRTKKFLQPLVQAMEKFLEGVASYQQRSLEIPEELKESILKDLDRLIALAEWGKFALPANSQNHQAPTIAGA